MRRLLLLACVAGHPALAQDGADLFATHCAACHGEGGVGNPGLAPPLNNQALWEGLGDEADTYLAGVALKGLVGRIESDGQTYAGLMMPPQAHIPEEEVALIGSYVLQDLGGLDMDLDAETLAAVREENPSHADLLSMRPEIE